LIDVLDIPGQPGTSNLRSWRYAANGAGIFQSWRRPRGVTMMHIMCVGSGGGGGGGGTGFSGAGAGAGGGGGAITRLTIPTFLLPPILYVSVAIGGTAGSGTGGSGATSLVSVAPSSVVTNVVCVSGNVNATGGTAGSGATPGTGGTGGSVAALTLMPLGGLGSAMFVAGQTGSSGSATNAATISVSMPVTGILCMGGAAGASALATAADVAGGGVTGVALTYLLEQQPPAPVAGANVGESGYNITKPFWTFSCAGGGTSVGGVGANGGSANQNSYGCGGGGGGGGSVSAGLGGAGGGGLVAIWAW
jgi:hypothetical protein